MQTAGNTSIQLSNSSIVGSRASRGGVAAIDTVSTAAGLRRIIEAGGNFVANNTAGIGALLFVEAAPQIDIDAVPGLVEAVGCLGGAGGPEGCALSGNAASNYGQIIAAPPARLAISSPPLVSPSAPFSVNVTILDSLWQQARRASLTERSDAHETALPLLRTPASPAILVAHT